MEFFYFLSTLLSKGFFPRNKFNVLFGEKIVVITISCDCELEIKKKSFKTCNIILISAEQVVYFGLKGAILTKLRRENVRLPDEFVHLHLHSVKYWWEMDGTGPRVWRDGDDGAVESGLSVFCFRGKTNVIRGEWDRGRLFNSDLTHEGTLDVIRLKS